MTHNQLKKLADEYGLGLKYVTSWAPPSDEDLRPLIAMPNIVRPLQGDKCQPRTIYRPKDWNAMRRACYERANDTCEICGECPEDKRRRQSHEVFAVDYEHACNQVGFDSDFVEVLRCSFCKMTVGHRDYVKLTVNPNPNRESKYAHDVI